ncbi:NYN domain-containing protein [Fervidobacterium sp.]
MGLKDFIRVAFFYDGYFFYKFSTFCYKKHPVGSRLNLRGFQSYILRQVADYLGVPLKHVRLAESHYFWGRPRTTEEAAEATQSRSRFEDALIASGVTIHTNHLVQDEERLTEKGVDISLAVEALDRAYQGRYDLLVLVSGDTDFVPLVRKLAALGVGVMVPKVEERYEEGGKEKWIKTGEQLIREAHFVVDFSRELRGFPWPAESELWRVFLPKLPGNEEEHFPASASRPQLSPADYAPEPLGQEWYTGTVIKTLPEKSAAFIRPDVPMAGLGEGEGLFVPPVWGLAPGVVLSDLHQGQRVRYKLGKNTFPPHQGKLVALEVTPV